MTANLDTSQTYDNEGKVLTVSYPNAGPTYTYAYDTMGRPISLTDNQSSPETWVNGVQYGLSSELLQIAYAGYYETRTYNSRLQVDAGRSDAVHLFADAEQRPDHQAERLRQR